MPPALFASWLVFAWVLYAATDAWPYPALDFQQNGPVRIAVFHVAIMLGSIVVGFALLKLNRLNLRPWVVERARKCDLEKGKISDGSVDKFGVAECGLDDGCFKEAVYNAQSTCTPVTQEEDIAA